MNQVFKGGFLAITVLVLGLLIGQVPRVHAEYDNIRQADVGRAWSTGTVAPSGTFTQTTAFLPQTTSSPGLGRAVNMSAAIQGTGTSPNFKVEVLCSFDGSTFVKPDVGGDLGTFTDANLHIVPIQSPLSPGGHKLKVTELGGANSITVVLQEAAQ